MAELIESITMDDLDEEQKELAEVISITSYRKLIHYYGGTAIYIPKQDNIEKLKRNELICEEFTGFNFRELAYKYNLTDRQIRSIVKDIKEEKRHQPAKNQMDMFELL